MGGSTGLTTNYYIKLQMYEIQLEINRHLCAELLDVTYV